MEREDQIDKITNSQDQILEKATRKASEQIRKERNENLRVTLTVTKNKYNIGGIHYRG